MSTHLHNSQNDVTQEMPIYYMTFDLIQRAFPFAETFIRPMHLSIGLNMKMLYPMYMIVVCVDNNFRLLMGGA